MSWTKEKKSRILWDFCVSIAESDPEVSIDLLWEDKKDVLRSIGEIIEAKDAKKYVHLLYNYDLVSLKRQYLSDLTYEDYIFAVADYVLRQE